MEATLNLMVGATAAVTAYSPTLDLSGWPQPSGSRQVMMELSWVQNYRNGTWGNVAVQHSADGSTGWATLWDLATLGGQSTKRFYAWNSYLRLAYTYTAGASELDPGARMTLGIKVYGLPDWKSAVPCRWEHFANVAPSLVDVAAGFVDQYPEQRNAAKLLIEVALRGRGINPHKLFLDGDATEQCVPGLEMAGAYKVLALVLGDTKVVKSDFWKDEMDEVDRLYQAAFESAINAGLATQDVDGDLAPSDLERVARPFQILR